MALLAILTNAGLNLILGPLYHRVCHRPLRGKKITTECYCGRHSARYVRARCYCTGYLQSRLMGGVGQRMLFKLRNSIFNKLQELPVDFFNQNKAGDLISRVNNDTDKINQFFHSR